MQQPWNPGSTGVIDNIFSRRDGENCPQGKGEKPPQDRPPTGHNDLFFLTRLLPSSYGSDDFSRIPPKTRTEIMTKRPHL
jgi:hypothetical protein